MAPQQPGPSLITEVTEQNGLTKAGTGGVTAVFDPPSGSSTCLSLELGTVALTLAARVCFPHS